MITNKKIVTIIGLGLIGSSILKAFDYYLKNKFYIKVYDNNYEHLKVVKSFNIADEICNSVEESVKKADLVILAIPVGIMTEVGKLICSLNKWKFAALHRLRKMDARRYPYSGQQEKTRKLFLQLCTLLGGN